MEKISTMEELTEDLIKVQIMDLIQWVAIRSTEFTTELSPYQRAVRDIADKYNVPSPFDKDEPRRATPQAPEK